MASSAAGGADGSAEETQLHLLLTAAKEVDELFSASSKSFALPSIEHYQRFWLQLSSSPSSSALSSLSSSSSSSSPSSSSSSSSYVSAVLTVFLAKMLAMETGEDRRHDLVELLKKAVLLLEPQSDSGHELARLPSVEINARTITLAENLLGSIHYISLLLFGQGAGKEGSRNGGDAAFAPLKTVLGRWLKLRGTRSAKASLDITDECGKILSGSHLQTSESLCSMVEQCTNPDISSFIPSLSFPSSTASSLYHVYLLRLLREARDDEKQVLALFDAVFMFLKHPLLVAEERLLSLLHLLRTFITSSQNLNEKLIQTLIELIRPYYLWPLPHGLVAKELLQMLSIELKSRGSAIRSRFFEDVPELVEGYKPSGRERVVHVLIDKELDNAERMKALLEAFSPPEMDLRELHLRLLCHSLLTHLRGVDDKDEDEPLSSEFLSLLQSCSLEDAQEFSWNASQILNQALLMNEAKAELFRISQLTSLKEDIIKHLSSSKTSKTNDPSSPSPSFSNGLTHLPSMNFEFHSITSSPLELITNYESPLKYARSSTADCLAKIFSSYQSSSADKQDNKPIVRIAIAGTDQTLHNVVGAFVYLRATRPTLFASSSSPELRVYHLPIVDHSPSRLSTFLSSRDVWYARNVCAMLQHVQRIVPAVPDASPLRSEKEQEEQTKQAAKEQQHDLNHYYNRNASPSCILRQALENYFREARNRVELNLWQAECWSENGAYRTIPFLQKAELGLEAFGIAYKMANSLDSSLTVKEMMEKKLFKYTPPSLSLKFTQVNLGGMARPGPTLEAKAYSLISLSSVPSSIGGERGTPPHPSQPWLELYALDSDVKKRKTKVSEERVYHVAQIELEVTDKRREPVDLLLDDVLYGPFIRIKISRCVDLKEDDIAFTLPMMTFFPTVNQV